MSDRNLTESLESVHGSIARVTAYEPTPADLAEMGEAFPAYEPSAEELEAEYRAYSARQLAATYERSVGGASRGRFVAYVKTPGSVRPVKVGTYRNEREAWAACDAAALRYAEAVIASGPQAA